MRMFLAILIANIANKVSRIFGKKGSVIGGSIALKIDPNILSKIKYPKYVIGVGGTSGKGSTVKLIDGLFRYMGLTSTYNVEGSNAINGLTSLVISNVNLRGVFKKDALIMEMDERHSVTFLNKIKLSHYILTNISRDQSPRNAHPQYIYDVLKNNIKDSLNIIANADDPMIYSLTSNHKKTLYYGINKNNYSKRVTEYNSIDACYCPICGKKLEYEYYHFGHLGKYKCPNNDFARPKVDILADDIDMDNKKIKINGDTITLKDDLFYLVYAYLGCYSLAQSIGIPKEKLLDYFEKIKNDNLKEKISFDNRTWRVVLSKTEANLSYKQSLDYIMHQKGTKTIVIGFNLSSRRYKLNDLTWLWDVDFEELKDKSVDKIVVVGKLRYNFLNRLLYTGIDKDKFLLYEDYTPELIKFIESKTSGNVYFVVWHDLMDHINELLKESGKNED